MNFYSQWPDGVRSLDRAASRFPGAFRRLVGTHEIRHKAIDLLLLVNAISGRRFNWTGTHDEPTLGCC